MRTFINCSVGNVLQSDCSKKKYSTKKKDVIYVESLNEEERQLLQIRVKAYCNFDALLDTACTYHKYFYIDSYSKHYQSCCNIFGNYKKSIRNSNLRVISLDWYKKVINQHPTINIIPGRKICSNCRAKIDNLKVSFQDMSSSSGSEIEEIQMQIDANQNLTNLNESLHVIEESPVKLQGLSSASRSNYGKRKLPRIQ